MGGNSGVKSSQQNGRTSLKIQPSRLVGNLRLPPSKSHAMRWLTLASMDTSPTKIMMWEIGEDVQAMIDCLIKLGSEWNGEELTGCSKVSSGGKLDCKNSGTALRFLIAQSATSESIITLDGDASLRARSSLQLVESLGVSANKTPDEQEYPITISGPFTKDLVEIDISKTSQFHSALMLMAPRTNGFVIKTNGEGVSRKHSELTWRLCKITGAKTPGMPWKVDCPDVVIPPDASMAAFARLAKLEVVNQPKQSESIGHSLERSELRDSNDLITPMAAWLAMGNGGVISGAKHAAYKESNRITKTAELLAQFGLKSEITEDGLSITGRQTPTRPEGLVKTFDDHRIQMTAILLASICGGEIEGPELHKVAWPSFLDQLVKCGLRLE